MDKKLRLGKDDRMESIKIMMEEHQYILRMLQVVRKMCLKILNNQELNYSDFYKIIEFVRNYADKHHHSKEEELLFKELKNASKGRKSSWTRNGHVN